MTSFTPAPTRRRRVAPFAALAAVTALGLAGCSAGSPSGAATGDALPTAAQCVEDGTTTLNVSHASTAAPSVELAVAKMEDAHPGLTVEATESSAPGYTEMAQQTIADKAGGKQVDVAQVGTDQVRLFVDTYDLAPLDPAALPATYDPAYLPVGEIGGELYAVPFQISLPTMFVNTDAMAAAGLADAAAPTTLDEALALALDYKAATDAGAVIGINNGPSSDDWFLQAMIESDGGQLGADDKAAFDSSAGLAAAQFYSTAASEGVLMHRPTTDTVAAFVSGQIPILFQSSAGIGYYGDQVGSAFEWTASLMPTTDTPVYAAGGNAFISLGDTDCAKVLGEEFISDLVSPEILIESLSSSTYQPVDTTVREQLLANEKTDARVKKIVTTDAAFSARSIWPGTSTPEVQQIIADMMEDIVAGEDAQSALTTGANAVNAVVAP